jgi:succinate dehydrogenase/fumarate reductase flavoprotein subunit
VTGVEIFRIRAPVHEPVASRESALPSRAARFDEIFDVVVVGGGCAGLCSALFAAWLGDRVLLLEKAPELGGTTMKSSFWYWVPNNGPLQDAGVDDAEEDFIAYCARTSRPERYLPGEATFGIDAWELSLIRAIYQSTWPAVKLLADRGALRFRHVPDYVDYMAQLPEDRTPRGRVLVPADARADTTDGGLVAVRNLETAAAEAGVDIRPGHRVQRLVLQGEDVVGVEASTVDRSRLGFGARKGVIFCSGGFAHDRDLCEHFLAVPSVGACAARSNEGDFVRIAPPAGAQLRNMQYAWRCPVPLEKVAAKDPHMQGTTSFPGDSMICVNVRGERCLNEKLPYNEIVYCMLEWDPVTCDFPNRVLIQIWDEHSQTHSQARGNSNIVPPGFHEHVFSALTLQALALEIGRRLSRHRDLIGSIDLAPDFERTLEQTIARWNEMARDRVDRDFHRGESVVDLEAFGGPVAPEPGKRNPLMRPIANEGPYYAALVAGGTLDTKGGAKTTPDGEVVDDLDRPIRGLYGVGNCVAGPQARAYWAGGATIGPIIGFAHRAATACHGQPERDL